MRVFNTFAKKNKACNNYVYNAAKTFFHFSQKSQHEWPMGIKLYVKVPIHCYKGRNYINEIFTHENLY